jgi:uncharacterized protein YidB (DUF937 family)
VFSLSMGKPASLLAGVLSVLIDKLTPDGNGPG